MSSLSFASIGERNDFVEAADAPGFSRDAVVKEEYPDGMATPVTPPSEEDSAPTTNTSVNAAKKKIAVSVSNLSYTIKARQWTEMLYRAGDSSVGGAVTLLEDINLLAQPGKLSVIIGPSGCGKTTLLNIIAGRALGKVSGNVCFNGLAVRAKELRGSVSYLPASDRLLPFLTVNETLMFNAILKLPNITTTERREAVDRTMELLALTHVKDTHIGGSLKKGLSSGEIRRCSIAQELIGDPAVILLDEPTSGLDAVLAYEVVALLKKVAVEGQRTVVCTLHQPRSASLKHIDQLSVLSKGKLIYSGTPDEARGYFMETLNRDINSIGAADDLIDIASDVVESLDVADDSPSTDERSEGKFVNVWVDGLADKAAKNYATSQLREKIVQEVTKLENSPDQAGVRSMRRESRNVVLQVLLEIGAITFRSFWNQLRNPLVLLVTFLIQIISGLLIGAIFFDLPGTYLPASEPLMISDPEAPSMQLIESKIVKFLTTGIDQEGTNPFVDMILHGVDGKGSMPIDVMVDSNAAPWLANMIPCLYEKLELDEFPEYASANFSRYKPLWKGYDEFSYFQGGPWIPPKFVENMFQTLQAADYAFYKNGQQWWNSWRYCRTNSAPMSCYVCRPVTGELLSAASTCTGLMHPPSTCESALGNSDDYLDKADPWAEVFSRPEVDRRELQARVDRVVDYVARADRGESAPAAPAGKRKLQASSLLSLNLSDLYAILPERLVKLGRTAEEYLDAFRNCEHPGCKVIIDMVESPSDESTSMLSDYGSVLAAVMNLAGALFFAVANIGFASYDGLTSICTERNMFNRETANKTYRASSYIIGKSVGDFLFQLIPVLLMATVFFFMIGMDTGPKSAWFWMYLVVCITVMFAAYGFSYIISALSPSIEVAIVASPLILVVFLCVAGFFIRDSAIPAGMAWIKYLSFYRWGFHALMLNQFPPDQYYHGLPNSFNLAVAGITETSIGLCCGMNIVLGVGYRLLAYVALKLTNKKVGVET